MVSTRPRISTRVLGGSWVWAMILRDFALRAADVFSRGRDVDVNRALQLVVVHFGGRENRDYVRDLIEVGRHFQVWARAAAWLSDLRWISPGFPGTAR